MWLEKEKAWYKTEIVFCIPFVFVLIFVEHSQMANARFQAAAALQESTIREWSLLMADEKSNMRKYVQKILFIRFIETAV